MTPKAVVRYCAEFDESENDLYDSLLLWSRFYKDIPTTNQDLPQWIAFKMSCSRRDALAVLRWSENRSQVAI